MMCQAVRFNDGALGAVVIVVAVHRVQSVDEALERLRQLFVSAGGVGPHGVTAVFRDGNAAQDRNFREGVNEGDVGVPGVGAAAAFGGVEFEQFGAFRRRDRRVGDNFAKTRAEGLMFGIGKMTLLAEEQHFVFDQRRVELGEGLGIQLGGKTDIADLRADVARHAA